MPETKSQRLLRMKDEEARVEKGEDDDDEAEPQDKTDEDPTALGGADADNPKDEPSKHTSKLDKDFETIL